MSNHMLLMSFGDDSYITLLKTLSRFLEYLIALIPKKKKVSFCYIGTAANDRHIENIFFTTFAYLKFGRHIHTSTLSLTKILTLQQIEDHVRQQDILFIGGGNTSQMLKTWEEKGFTNILNKLKNENQLPILAGVSAGGMYPFHSGLSSSYLPGYYTPIPCLGWFSQSFCPHASSQMQRLCEFDNNQLRSCLEAYILAVQLGKLPPGYAVPDDCMLHFYNNQLIHALTSRQDATCLFVTPDKTQSLEATFLTQENSVKIALQVLQKLNQSLSAQDLIFPNNLPDSTG